MAGGKSTPKHDKGVKISGGMIVKKGQILVAGRSDYKAGENVNGITVLYAACDGKVYFTKKKTTSRSARTFINISPQ